MRKHAYAIVTTLLTLLGLAGLFGLRLVGLYSHQALGLALLLGCGWAIASLIRSARKGAAQAAARPGIPWRREPAPTPPGAGARELLGAERRRVPRGLPADGGVHKLDRRAGRRLRAPDRGFLRRPGPAESRADGPPWRRAPWSWPSISAASSWGTPAAEARIAPPFDGEWVVLQGGDSPLQNHHLVAYNQHFALDLVRLEDGRIFADGDGNAGVHSWEQPLQSPADGTVVVARGGMEDSEGANFVTELEDAAGNVIVIELDSGHFVVLAHLRQGSLRGQRGRPGAGGRSAGAGRELGQHDDAAPAPPGADPSRPLGRRQPLGALCVRAR